MGKKKCTRCNKLKPNKEFYGVARYHCAECERKTARYRMGRKENQIKQAHRDAKRIAARYGVENTLTLDDLRYLFAVSGGRCAYTGRLMLKPTIEHVVPMSRGGANAIHNVVIAEHDINLEKKAHDPCDWLELRGLWDVERELTKLMAARKGVTTSEMSAELSAFQAIYNNEAYQKMVAGR